MGNITGQTAGEDHGGQDSGTQIHASPVAYSGAGGSGPLPATGSTSLTKGKKQGVIDETPYDDEPTLLLEKIFGDRGVPMVFRWELGGDEVFITGTFNNWSAKIPMTRSGNDFIHIHELSRGKHAYKFIVDDEWRFTSDQHTMADKSGNINNFLDLTEFNPRFENLPDLHISLANKYLDEALYGNRIPDINEYTKEPPTLPPHLRSIVLNHKAGVPQHVTLDHLYCTARKDGLMVLGMSQRYQQKFVTTIYYSPVNGGFPNLVPGSKRAAGSTVASALSMPTSTTSSAAGSVTPQSAGKTAPAGSAGAKRNFGQ